MFIVDFEQIAEQYKIMKHKCKKVMKQYAFEKEDVPVESEYLELRYGESRWSPSTLNSDTVSHIAG